MDSVKQRILDNIESDAINHIKYGTPMPNRGDAWIEASAKAVQAASLIYKAEPKKKRKGLTPEQKLERLKKKIAAKQGITYEEWRKIAASLYTINPETFEVTSIARGPDHMRTWPAPDDISAQERIYKLMNYKYYDHFERETPADFAYVPEKKEETTSVQD